MCARIRPRGARGAHSSSLRRAELRRRNQECYPTRRQHPAAGSALAVRETASPKLLASSVRHPAHGQLLRCVHKEAQRRGALSTTWEVDEEARDRGRVSLEYKLK